jgi:RHS repeat-associated protein
MKFSKSVIRYAQRAALSLGIGVLLFATHFAPTDVQAADLPADTPSVVRDRDQAIKSLSAQLEKIGEELARIQPVGAAKPSSATVQGLKGDAEPVTLSERVLAEVDALGDFEAQIASDWRAEADEMRSKGLPAEVVDRNEALLQEVLQRAGEFRSLVATLRSARGRGTSAVSAPLADMADFFAKQTKARAWRAITKSTLPLQFARAADTRAPVQPQGGDVAPAAAGDPPGTAELAETLDVQFTTAIKQLATSLGGQPVAIRNWVYNNIEFHPTFGSVQGADLTLLSRRGNAFDIASLTLALMRTSGIPARYAHGVVEIPIEKAQNWLGNVGTPQMAVDMMQKGGIPAASVIAGGRIVAVRFEHVWVEAWVDFIPSRGAINRVPDQWVPFDVAFKQFDFPAQFNWRDHTTAARQSAVGDFVAHVTVDSTGGIKGFDFDKLNQDYGNIAKQLADDMRTADPNANPGDFEDKRAIKPIDSLILEGSLPYPLRSTTVTRYNEVPAALRQTAEVEFFADESSIALESPSQQISLPLVRLGTKRFGVDYAPATPADAAAIASYATSNAASMPVGQINVIPRLMLGDEVLFQGGAVRMGTQHFWHVNVRDAQGSTTTTEAYQFAAGSPIVFGADLAGVTPERVEREGANLPDVATLPQREAMYYAGLLYWGLTDHLESQAARSLGGYSLRLPSIGAFAQPYQVSYFFGIPRNGYVNGHVTDVKAARVGMGVPKQSDFARLAMHAGSAGSMAEGATWSLLAGTTTAGLGMSAATALQQALDGGQRLFQISAANLDVAMSQLQLSSFAEEEIRQSVQSGMIVVAHEKEVHYHGWSGSGYVVFDPVTGNSLQRVEGGFSGGINIGCIATAVALTALCRLKFIQAFKRILFQLAEKLFARIMQMAGVEALVMAVAPELAVVLPIIAAVFTAVSIAMATYEVLTWVREIQDGIENLTPADLAQLGINALNEVACSYMPPCLGGFGAGGGSGGGGSGGGGAGDDRGAGGPIGGNPVAIGSGTKWQTETDYEGDGIFPLAFARTYASSVPNVGGFVGSKWTATYFQAVKLPPNLDGSPYPVDQRPDAVMITRPEGGWYEFDWRDTTYVSESNIPGRLERLTNGTNTSGWRYTTPQNTIETFDAQGRLQSIANLAGVSHVVSYDNLMRPIKVTHTFGRTLEFIYDSDTGYLKAVKDPQHRDISLQHDDFGNLTQVQYPDQKTRQYLYEDLTQRYQLTGLVDERGVRFATWTYDHLGRALSSEHAGGSDRYTFQYDDDYTIVTDPLNTQRTYQYTTLFNRKYLLSVTEACGSCSGGVAAKTTYDGRGLITGRTDFEGRVTTYARNDRGLVEVMTEAAGTPLARVTRTTWHPTWYLPLTLDEPVEGGTRHTVFDYDAQGNLRTRAVTAGGQTRVWTYDYDSHGQRTVEDGPRQDVSDRLLNTYDPVSGDLTSTTDASGNTRHFTDRDSEGRLTQSTDANGRITQLHYDARGRVTRKDEKSDAADPGRSLIFAYTDSGNVEKLTLPDGSYRQYSYDAADRLTDIADASGQHVHYTLDGQDHRVREETFDSSHQRVADLHREYDTLGRLQKKYGADASQSMQFGYSQDGDDATEIDALGHRTSYSYDALDRLNHADFLEVTDPDHASIGVDYDAADNMVRVTDPRGLITRYGYDGFGDLMTASSPNTGNASFAYDGAGNPGVSTDARGQRSVYVYDAMNRPRQIRFGTAVAGDPAGLVNIEETLAFGYDESGGGEGAKGQLTSFSDGAGTTHFRYDRQGRVLQREQSLGDGSIALTKALAYRYDDGGRVDQATLPSGAVVGYSYGADGRVHGMTVNGVTLVGNIDYFPFGTPKAWTQGATGFRYTRGFDADGRIKTTTLGDGIREVSYDAANRVEHVIDTATPGSGVPLNAAAANWGFGYDSRDRLQSALNAASSGPQANLNLVWDYDATSNRTSQTRNGLIATYNTAVDSDRLMAMNGMARTYDAAGNTASDGSYRYSSNARNRLSVTRLQGTGTVVARYGYNATGERVCKAIGDSQCPAGAGAPAPSPGSGNFVQYFYDDDGRLIGEYDNAGQLIAEHLWLERTPIGVIVPASVGTSHAGTLAGGVGFFFVETDHLDTPRVLVNASHQTVWRWDSTPFGDTPANENPAGLGSFHYSLRFAGQQYDAETQTHYNYFRDYEPLTGRFLESDPAGLSGGINAYGYVEADPLSSTDDDGLKTRRPGKRKSTDDALDSRAKGKCEKCGTTLGAPGSGKGPEDHHITPWRLIRDGTEAMLCMFANQGEGKTVVRKLQIELFNLVSNLTRLCETCHDKEHGKNPRYPKK